VQNLSLDTAFARRGAQGSSRQRSLSGAAADGSLVLVCQSVGFSRPNLGILRYQGMLSNLKAGPARITLLREQLKNAQTESTDIRPIILTPVVGRSSFSVHVRADLFGKVTEFDGDTYTVDFSRPPPPEAPPRVRRKR
jgi:hypothetical protein